MSAPSTSTLIDLVRTAYQTRLSGGLVNSYSMPDGRNLQYMTLTELMALDKHLTAVQASESANGAGFTYASFNTPL